MGRQAGHVVVEQGRHPQDLARIVVHHEAVVARVPIDVCHDGVHGDHLSERLLDVVLGAKFEHVTHAKHAVEESMRRDEPFLFGGEQGAFAGKLPMELHKRVRHVRDFCRLQQVRRQHLGIWLEASVGIAR